MTKIYNWLKKSLLSQKTKESFFFYASHFLYKIFTNGLTEAITTILGTVFIALFIGIHYFGAWFWVVTVIYVLSLLLIVLARTYQQETLKELYSLKQSLISVDATLYAWAVRLQKSAKSIYNSNEKTSKSIKKDIEGINFQNAAFFVCENIAKYLTKYCEDDNIYVTVYQKYLTEKKEPACKMIAFSGNHEPTSYGVPYIIPEFSDELLGKIEYHTYLFSSDKKDISVLCNQAEVEKAFKKHQKSEDREKKIQQYIGVPIAPAKSGVTFLLQIDTNIANLFGKEKETVENFSKIAIYPFAQFLHMIYEEARTIEQIIGGIEENENKS